MSTFIDLDSYFRDRQSFSNPCEYQVTAEQVDTWVRSAREVNALPKNPGERPLDFVSALNLTGATLPFPRIELFASNFITLDHISGGTTLNTIANHHLGVGDIVMTSSPGFATRYGIQRNVEYNVVTVPTLTSFTVSLTNPGPNQTFTNGTGINLTLAVISAAEYATVIAANNEAALLTEFPRVYVDVHSIRYNDSRKIFAIQGRLSDAKFVLIFDKYQYDLNGTPIWIHYRSHGEQVMRFKRDDPLFIRFMTRNGHTIDFFDEDDLTINTNPAKQSLITLDVTPYARDAHFVNQATTPISS